MKKSEGAERKVGKAKGGNESQSGKEGGKKRGKGRSGPMYHFSQLSESTVGLRVTHALSKGVRLCSTCMQKVKHVLLSNFLKQWEPHAFR